MAEDVVQEYRRITGSLMKRGVFRRRRSMPSVNKQADLLRLLADVEAQGCKEYAAFIALSVAACEEALATSQLVPRMQTRAGLLLFDAEHELRDTGDSSLHECYDDAVRAFLLAIQVHAAAGRTSLAAGLMLELGHQLRGLGRVEEASTHLQEAALLLEQTSCPSVAWLAFKDALECEIADGHYESACGVLRAALAMLSSPPAKSPRSLRSTSSMTSLTVDPEAEVELLRLPAVTFRAQSLMSALTWLALVRCVQRQFSDAYDALRRLEERVHADGPVGFALDLGLRLHLFVSQCQALESELANAAMEDLVRDVDAISVQLMDLAIQQVEWMLVR